MMRIRAILLWPFALLGGLFRLLFWPAAVLAAGYYFLPSAWFVLVVAVVGIFTLVVVRVWATVVRGSMRTMARGTVNVREQRSRRPSDGRRSKGAA